MTEEWSLLTSSPPDLARLLHAIDQKDIKEVDEVISDNEGLLLGKSEYFGPWTLYSIASGHRNGLWVLEKYREDSEINSIMKESESDNANILAALTAPALYKDAKAYYPGLLDKGFCEGNDPKAYKLSKEGGWTPLLVSTLLGPLCNLAYLFGICELSACTSKTQRNIKHIAESRGNEEILSLIKNTLEFKFSQRKGWKVTLKPLCKTLETIGRKARLPHVALMKFIGLEYKDICTLSAKQLDDLLLKRGLLPGHLARFKRELKS
mmetsp:Transcript_21102/g.31454  ORF Transcript_21102/g.31454 Transcript_21102/m.31454 type:complete len:265 (+) Transcript_21102:3-797(+)